MHFSITARSSVLGFLTLCATITAAPAFPPSNSASLPDYKEYQISTGRVGDALEQAQAVYTKLVGANVFTDPHSITDEQDRKISAIRITASQAENTFVKEINRAGRMTPEGMAYFNGLISNKVLKLTGMILLVKSNIAKTGANHASSDSPEQVQALIDKNVKLNKAAAGQPQKGVDG